MKILFKLFLLFCFVYTYQIICMEEETVLKGSDREAYAAISPAQEEYKERLKKQNIAIIGKSSKSSALEERAQEDEKDLFIIPDSFLQKLKKLIYSKK